MRRIAAEASGASTGELVEAAGVIALELASREAPGSAVACMELAEGLGAALDVGEAALARLVHRVDASGEVHQWGFSSTSAWLRNRLGMRTGRAGERVTLARQLGRLSLTAKRLRAGDLSYGYAATISEAVSRLDDADALAGEQILLGLADGGGSANQVAKAGYRISEVIAERDGREPEPEDARRGFKRSWIQRSRSLGGGSWFKGWLSPEHTAVFDELVDPLAKPTGAADDRDHAERTADALFCLLTQGHHRATVTVIIDLDTLYGGTTPAYGETAPARLLGGGRLAAQRARELALTAGVSALILGPGGRPLYLGRRSRFATHGQRQTLLTRYAHCAAEGCEIPARLCEIHHTGGGWKAGVPTDIDRLAPLCGFHNQWVEDHPRRVQETTDGQGRYVIRCLPPWEPHPGDEPSDRTEPPKPPGHGHGPGRNKGHHGPGEQHGPGGRHDDGIQAQGP
jgi:hypothetical protein